MILWTEAPCARLAGVLPAAAAAAEGSSSALNLPRSGNQQKCIIRIPVGLQIAI
jgi:hypothetical protein